jgi:TonB family protein
MPPSDLGTKYRSIANQQLRTILAASLGGSIVLHLGVIAGIAHWWQPAVSIDETDPIEITLVEPLEKAVPPSPVVRSTSKPVPPPKITPVKPKLIKSIAKSITPSTPNFTPLLPKQIATKSSPTRQSKGLQSVLTPVPVTKTRSKPTSKPQPKSIDQPPTPMPSPEFNLPFPSAPSSVLPQQNVTKNVREIPAKPSGAKIISTQLPQSTPPPKTDRQDRPPSISNNKPRQIDDSLMPRDRQSEGLNSGRSVDNNPPIFPAIESSPIGIKPPKNPADSPPNRSKIGAESGGNLTGNLATNLPPGNTQTSGSSNSPPNGSKMGEGSSGKPTGNSASNMPTGETARSDSGITKLECIKYCEIPKLRDLQDTDGGKDRLRIRIVADAQGVILDASIAKSSGNPQIDSAALEGIKQMQFAPSGQEVRGVVKANILIRAANPDLICSIA